MEEIAEINLDSRGNLLPPKTDKVALIDADTLVFAACVATEIREELLPRDFYLDVEWMEIENDPYFDYESHTLGSIDMDIAYQNAIEKLNNILDKTGCSDYELHFTGGNKSSFRYTMVSSEYKANRRDFIPPVGLLELKVKFASEQPDKCFVHTCFEADDAVVAKKSELPDKYIICAVDKDVLYSLPGRHFNYYTSVKYDIDMKWVDVIEEEAMKHHFIQTLTGDPGDNVIGIRGIGPAKASKILAECTTPKECWEAVKQAYEDNGRNIIDAIINMRLVSMNQISWDSEINEYKLKLYGKDTYERCE